jgi:hypothetical protein
MSETTQHQNLDHDDFSYFYDTGDPCIIVVDSHRLTVEPGDRVSLGKDGDEGTYWICAVLPLHPDFIHGRSLALLLRGAEYGECDCGYVDHHRELYREYRNPEGVARPLLPSNRSD